MISNAKQKLKKGFTLIETLIAVFLLVMAVAGPLTIASRSLSIAVVAKDKITAYYLAQDAIEYVRWIRDTNLLKGEASWSAGFDGTRNDHTISIGNPDCVSASGADACHVDSFQDRIDECGAAGCPPLRFRYNASGGSFSTSGSGATGIEFTREVRITSPVGSNSDEAVVTVTVRWNGTGGIPRSIVVRENIFNWQ